MDTENKVYVLNQKKLAKELDLAYITVKKAFSLLQRQGFLRKKENGLYMVNPHIACKVNDPRDLVVHFVDSETFEEFIESATRGEKAVG
jgi:DNA-binding transcriptional regulator YhcF (GntR family)